MLQFFIKVFDIFLDNVWYFYVNILSWRIGEFYCTWDKGSFIYDIRREGGAEESQDLEESGLALVDVRMYMK